MVRSDLPSEEEQCDVEVPAAPPAGDLLAPASSHLDRKCVARA